MNKECKEERKTAYILAVKINSLTASKISRIHKVSKNTIEKWLYVENRYPDFQALFELRHFIKKTRKELPIELERLFLRSMMRVTEAIELGDVLQHSTHKLSGVRKGEGRRASRLYTFKGEQLNLKEISEKLDEKPNNVNARIFTKGLNYELADVSFLEFNQKNKRKI